MTQAIYASAARHFRWLDTATAIQGSVPTALFSHYRQARWLQIVLEGVDLVAAAAAKTIFGSGTTQPQKEYLKDCKLGATVTIFAAITNANQEVFVSNCDSGAVNYRNEKHTYRGSEIAEIAIFQTGGATDRTTPSSRKITTTANSKWIFPFTCLAIPIWLDTVGAQTLTIEGTINAVAVPNNDELWMDVEYLGSALTPLGSFASGTKANNLATGTALTASLLSWDGGGSGVGWSPFKISKAITTGMKGFAYIYVSAAKASTTWYIDPKVTVS